jgi:diguanylate cyclase (GGDEF)-like protein
MYAGVWGPMSGAGFILAINLVVSGLLAGAFALLALQAPARTGPRWLAAGYFLGVVYFSVEGTIAGFGAAPAAVVLSFAIALAAMLAFVVGVARHYRTAPPFLILAALFVLSTVACALIQDLPRTSILRMLVYQAPYFVAQAIAASIVLGSGLRGRLDRAFGWLLAASALHFLSKPFLMSWLGGTGVNAGEYLRTEYALASQTLATMFVLSVAIGALAVMVRDVLSDVTAKSETDALSGLLNRAGFERVAATSVANAARGNLPVSLVVADLDHFKTVNDSYGHIAGDRVIRCFSALISEAARGLPTAARIGGEEFAIILPGSNIAAARLFAEGARSAFAALPVEGLPRDRRFTASFGVAERIPGETIADLMRRADEALYDAKKAGRDRVRTAPWLVVEGDNAGPPAAERLSG